MSQSDGPSRDITPLLGKGTSSSKTENEEQNRYSRLEKWRNVVGFWILGICNNYPFIIMLSAAFDILDTLEEEDDKNGGESGIGDGGWKMAFGNGSANSSSDERDCHDQSTGVILLAGVLPNFVIRLILPYIMNFIPYWIRVLTIVAFSAMSFVVVGLNGLAFNSVPLVFLGVVCASISSGFGELTFLALTARYDRTCVAGWSSGTGVAAVLGSLVYLVLRTVLSTQVTVLIQVFMPIVLLINFTFIMGKPSPQPVLSDNRYDLRKEAPKRSDISSESETLLISEDSNGSLENTKKDSFTGHQRWWGNGCKVPVFNKEEAVHWKSHVQYTPWLFKYMVPLFLVFLAEYMINQGLYELFIYPNTSLGQVDIDTAAQYRVLQVMYQVGVLISRSSIFVLHIKHFWILALLQVVNFVFLFCEAVYLFIPSFWITFVIILYEGLLGGGAYANAFYTITKEVPEIHREFSMGLASVADCTGVVAAGVVSIFIHKYICGLPT